MESTTKVGAALNAATKEAESAAKSGTLSHRPGDLPGQKPSPAEQKRKPILTIKKLTKRFVLAGFETPTSGSIMLGNQELIGVPPYKRPVNMMFQSYALFPYMTVGQNIAFGLKQSRLPKAEIAERVDRMLRLVHMEQYVDRKPFQLSGGQRQRVALARSLAKEPRLLLLDEPMGALDKKLREQMRLELVDIINSVGVTCLMVTHDQEEAMTMADRIAIMDRGEFIQIGGPREIYENPNCRFCAEFIGP